MKEIFEKLATIIDSCIENKNNVNALLVLAENLQDIISKAKAYDDANLKEDIYKYLFGVFSSEKFIKGEFGIDLSPDKRQEIAKIILDSKLTKD
jgi:hypothetical protein